MSNIYIQEPPTSGKVVLITSIGDIEIELWAKEAPLACRNFIQLCMEKYYNNTIFHRVVKDFIVQGGDPTGTGEGGESIYGHPFKDEFHTRLRFCRRGLVAMANAGKDDNGSQFFFTLGPTQELQNKHTIFGKVAGDTIYNMLKLGETLVDDDERPIYPQKVITSEVLNNPFNDIVPRVTFKSKEEIKEKEKKSKSAAVKNFKLLSFGEEAEEDEEEIIAENKKFVGKGKSAHDTLLDPKLSSKTADEVVSKSMINESEEERIIEELLEIEKKEMTDRIKSKLTNKNNSDPNNKIEILTDNDEEEVYYLGKEKKEEDKKKLQEIKKDIRNFKREIKNEKKSKEITIAQKEKEQDRFIQEKKEYIESQAKYKAAQASLLSKKASKDDFAAKMLAQFKNRLRSTKNSIMNEEEEEEEAKAEKSIADEDSWMRHSFQSEEKLPVLAKDASTKDDDWFEIYDPRNPLNKRRRGETTEKKKKFKS